MTFRVVILSEARGDIDRNSEWWAEHHSVEQALRWSDAIYDQIESLSVLPERNALSPENHAFPFEIRDKLVGLGTRPSYRAVFRIQENTVYVLAVRSASQDALRPEEVDPPPPP